MPDWPVYLRNCIRDIVGMWCGLTEPDDPWLELYPDHNMHGTDAGF